jgi:SAM-dependent methyltransferase
MFEDIINRSQDADVWQKIPWDDPDFSRRMLKEHLSQTHDVASRRTAIIDRQVDWIQQQVLNARPSNVLDLGCGPGLYTARLAHLGHRCTGIDFSPASIEYARQNSPGTSCTYVQADVRNASFGADFDFAMMIFGELNTFTVEDAQHIVDKAYDALKPAGKLLLEIHPYQVVERIGQQPATWYSAQTGLFSEYPYLCLQESFFKAGRAVTRHYVIDARTGATTHYASMLQAYTDSEYRHLLRRFGSVVFYPTLATEADQGDLAAILAQKS